METERERETEREIKMDMNGKQEKTTEQKPRREEVGEVGVEDEQIEGSSVCTVSETPEQLG